MAPETLPQALARAADSSQTGLRFLDRHEKETWVSWSEIEERALAAAGGLRALGVASGERVALVYPTSPAFVSAFFGVLLAGGAPAPLYPPLRLGRLREYQAQTARLVQAAGARLILADPHVRRLLGEAVSAAEPALGCLTLEELAPGEVGEAAASVSQPSDIALVQFSSGTTGEPRPVALSHRALLAQVEALNAHWRDTPEEIHSGVSWLPLYHDMGLVGFLLSALWRPAVLTLLPPEAFAARPALWLRAISRYRATVSAAPNFAYALCTEKIRDQDLEGVDLSSWSVALNGAETVTGPVLRAFATRFAPWGFRSEALTPVYGLSEASLAVTFSEIMQPFHTRRFDRAALSRGLAEEDPGGTEIVAVGRPLLGFAVRIQTESGAELGPRRIGRVWVSGPSLFEGYLGQPEASAEVLRGGWLDTGDLGFVLDGELYLTGRAKDVLILRGRNHAPEAVEEAAGAVPGVRFGAAVAASFLPEGGAEELLALFVERERGLDEARVVALAPAVRDAVLTATGLEAALILVLDPGTLPRTSSGKLRRGEALRRHLAGELRAPEEVSAARLHDALQRSQQAFRALGDEGERSTPRE